jgi:hypothetical protein
MSTSPAEKSNLTTNCVGRIERGEDMGPACLIEPPLTRRSRFGKTFRQETTNATERRANHSQHRT